RLIREAQHQKAPAQRFTDRFSAIYTWFVLAMFVVMYFAWWLIFGLAPGRAAVEMHSALYRAGTLLVVASPCALVLSIPSAVLAAIAWGARHGVLFRGGAAVEKLAETDVVALDKTGTLTTGDLKVERVESFPAGRENEIARLACSLEKLSAHPLARAITRYGKQQGIAAVELEHFESVTGQGLRGQWNGKMCLLGRRDWLSEAVHQPLPFAEGRGAGAPALVESAGVGESPDSRREILPTMPPAGSGVSEICIVCGDLSGRILLRDDVRPQSLHVIEELRAERLTTLVLTGDRQAAARHLQEQLHLDDVRAELKPEGKVAAIRALAGEGRRVAMIGDGVNDAPSLAAAHVGVAMGARGSDAALEQADVVLMHDRLENFLAAFRLSRRARRIIRQNLVISLGTVVTLVTFALLGKIPLTIGVVGHEGSTVVVVMNSLRLLFGEFIQPRLKHG
ncbi:MAG: cation-translocating P-type ATPase, partial [Verrucomicrobia bacterium]|nr:cation-translocating P-type ATPase [Verrucomicrobiota bacterium]